jgi:hypothetical protein
MAHEFIQTTLSTGESLISFLSFESIAMLGLKWLMIFYNSSFSHNSHLDYHITVHSPHFIKVMLSQPTWFLPSLTHFPPSLAYRQFFFIEVQLDSLITWLLILTIFWSRLDNTQYLGPNTFWVGPPPTLRKMKMCFIIYLCVFDYG